MTTAPLLAGLREEGRALSDGVMDAMYAEDPFWSERYGARGRRNADQDGGYHVTYLVEALTAHEPQLFVRYAIWLRHVLAGRGMASRHLIENFDRLGAAIAARGWSGADRALAILAGASAALVHRDGAGAAVEEKRAAWCASLSAELARAAPDRAPEGGRRPHWTVDADLYVWYLADALALALPTGFESHLVAVRSMEARAGKPSVVPVVTRHLSRVAGEARLPARVIAMLEVAASGAA